MFSLSGIIFPNCVNRSLDMIFCQLASCAVVCETALSSFALDIAGFIVILFCLCVILIDTLHLICCRYFVHD